MAGGREDLNLQLETGEFMDQTSVKHDHVVTIIPPAPSASSIAPSSAAAAEGFQTLNSPCKGDPSVVSTTGAANTQDRSRGAPRRQRSRRCRWNVPCFWRTFHFCCTSIQIILLVVFLSVFRNEHPHVALRVWTIGYGAGCLAMLALLCCSYKHSRELQSNRLPQVSGPGSEVAGERLRFGKILKWSRRLLEGFFVLWFWVGMGIVDRRWASRQAPHLNLLCSYFLIFSCFRFILPWTTYIVMRWCAIGVLVRDWPRGAKANVISALPTYKFHACETTDQARNKDNDGVRVSIGGDETQVAGAPVAAEVVVECCICLDPYEDGMELKELPCTHHFHVKCADRWLKINGSCPICKREVGTSIRASAMERTFMI